MRAVLAIDPGREGGFAFLDEESVILEPMPQNDEKKVDLTELHRLLFHYVPQTSLILLEQAGMRPGQSANSTASTWRHFGHLEGVLASLRAAFPDSPQPSLVHPASWSKWYPHGVTEKNQDVRYKLIKKSRAVIAQGLYPGVDLKKSAKSVGPHEGLVDALLLADFGMRRLKEQSK